MRVRAYCVLTVLAIAALLGEESIMDTATQRRAHLTEPYLYYNICREHCAGNSAASLHVRRYRGPALQGELMCN